jgi:hypothetical protein
MLCMSSGISFTSSPNSHTHVGINCADFALKCCDQVFKPLSVNTLRAAYSGARRRSLMFRVTQTCFRDTKASRRSF